MEGGGGLPLPNRVARCQGCPGEESAIAAEVFGETPNLWQKLSWVGEVRKPGTWRTKISNWYVILLSSCRLTPWVEPALFNQQATKGFHGMGDVATLNCWRTPPPVHRQTVARQMTPGLLPKNPPTTTRGDWASTAAKNPRGLGGGGSPPFI